MVEEGWVISVRQRLCMNSPN